MAIDVTLESPAPPAAVLASIRRLAGEWRESKIPAALREDRVLAIEGYVEGAKFRFAYMRRWYWRGESELDVRGTVRSGPNGGSIVTVHCGTGSRLAALFSLAFGAVAVWFFRGGWQGWAFLGIVVVLAAVTWRGEAGITRVSHPQADYLVRRIEAAVTAAVEPEEISPPQAG